MIDNEVTKVVLLQAIEGEAGLWELVWELNTIDPAGEAAQHQERAAAVLGEQVARGWVDLFYSNEPDGALIPIPRSETAKVLGDPQAWEEPRPGGRSIRVSATPAGDAAYRTMGR